MRCKLSTAQCYDLYYLYILEHSVYILVSIKGKPEKFSMEYLSMVQADLQLSPTALLEYPNRVPTETRNPGN